MSNPNSNLFLSLGAAEDIARYIRKYGYELNLPTFIQIAEAYEIEVCRLDSRAAVLNALDKALWFHTTSGQYKKNPGLPFSGVEVHRRIHFKEMGFDLTYMDVDMLNMVVDCNHEISRRLYLNKTVVALVGRPLLISDSIPSTKINWRHFYNLIVDEIELINEKAHD